MNLKSNKINIGFIGYGKFAIHHHNTLKEFDNLSFLHVLKKKKISINGVTVHNNFYNFKKNRFDIILIITPAVSHFKILKKVHDVFPFTIIEKPLFNHLEEYNLYKALDNKKKIIVNYSELFNLNLHKYLNYLTKKKISEVSLFFGIKQKVDDLSFYVSEWLPHPLSILILLFKNINLVSSKIKFFDKIYFKAEISLLSSENVPIKLIISNNYSPKKRQIKISTKNNKTYTYSSGPRNRIAIDNKNISIIKGEKPLYNLWNYAINKKHKNIFDSFQSDFFHKKIIEASELIMFNINSELKKLSSK